MKFPKLFQRVVLRSIKEERFLTALSVLGVALGIGLYLGVNVATDRAVSSFSANISSLNPASTYEVLDSSGLDFSDVLYQRVRSIAGESLPVLTAHAFIPSAKETITINGIYTVKTFLFSDRAERNTVPLKDFLQDLSGVVITRPFAQKHQLRQGSVFNAYVYTKEYPLKVAGVTDDPSVPSNEAFMDLGNFQEYFGKTGLLSRIDVKADEKEAEEIGRALPSGVMIEKKQVILQHRKGLIDAFQFNLRFVTFLAVLVGVFLLYNTIFISVVKRRKEIGILRGLGMGKVTVLSLFLGQGLLLEIARLGRRHPAWRVCLLIFLGSRGEDRVPVLREFGCSEQFSYGVGRGFCSRARPCGFLYRFPFACARSSPDPAERKFARGNVRAGGQVARALLLFYRAFRRHCGRGPRLGRLSIRSVPVSLALLRGDRALHPRRDLVRPGLSQRKS